MIEVYKILTNKYDTGVDFNVEKYRESRTKWHNLKLVNHRFHYHLRKYSFTGRIVNTGNTINSFKNV